MFVGIDVAKAELVISILPNAQHSQSLNRLAASAFAFGRFRHAEPCAALGDFGLWPRRSDPPLVSTLECDCS
jgi:hypothetical protein